MVYSGTCSGARRDLVKEWGTVGAYLLTYSSVDYDKHPMTAAEVDIPE